MSPQKGTFRSLICHLLRVYMPPFTRQKGTFCFARGAPLLSCLLLMVFVKVQNYV